MKIDVRLIDKENRTVFGVDEMREHLAPDLKTESDPEDFSFSVPFATEHMDRRLSMRVVGLGLPYIHSLATSRGGCFRNDSKFSG